MQKFSGDATPTPRRIDLRAYGAQAQRDTPPSPKKILVTALHNIDGDAVIVGDL